MVENPEETDKSVLGFGFSERPLKKDDGEAERKEVEKSLDFSPDVTNPHRALEKHPSSRPAKDPNLVSSYENNAVEEKSLTVH